jgi:uncharacterized protein (TIGR00369 family)
MTREEAQRLLASCAFHGELGLELVEWEVGRVTFEFVPPASTRADGNGGVHGGALATAIDTAATFAVISSLGHDASTVDLRLDYLRPALDRSFVVEGTTSRAGKRLAWADAALSTLDGRLVACGRGTFIW